MCTSVHRLWRMHGSAPGSCPCACIWCIKGYRPRILLGITLVWVTLVLCPTFFKRTGGVSETCLLVAWFPLHLERVGLKTV